MDGNCKINDPVFVRQVAKVCCALHNVCKRYQCPFEPGWVPDLSAYAHTTPATLQANVVIESASSICDATSSTLAE